MDGVCRVIDIDEHRVLGTFASKQAAVEHMRLIAAVTDGAYLDVLVVADASGILLQGEALRNAIRQTDQFRETDRALTDWPVVLSAPDPARIPDLPTA